MNASEKKGVELFEKYEKYIAVPAQFVILAIICLLFAAAIIYAIAKNGFSITLLGALLFVIAMPIFYWLNYYAKKVPPEARQKLTGSLFLILLVILGIPFVISIIILMIAGIAAAQWIYVIVLLFSIVTVLFFIFLFIWLLLGKKASFNAEPSKQVLFPKSISTSYKTNVMRGELIMLAAVVIGFALRYFKFSSTGFIFIFIGIGGMFIIPISSYLMPPKAFLLKKTQEELKGKVELGEKMIGAVYGTEFPARPGIALESVDNALFITNKHIFSITLPGQVFGGQISDASPFYKTQIFDYLKKKGDALLKKTPKEILYSHDYNFSIPFDKITEVKLYSNIFLKAAGINTIRVHTDEGVYTFGIYYPDQFEKLKILLKQTIPGKLR